MNARTIRKWWIQIIWTSQFANFSRKIQNKRTLFERAFLCLLADRQFMSLSKHSRIEREILRDAHITDSLTSEEDAQYTAIYRNIVWSSLVRSFDLKFSKSKKSSKSWMLSSCLNDALTVQKWKSLNTFAATDWSPERLQNSFNTQIVWTLPNVNLH